MDIDLTAQQQEAVDKVLAWYDQGPDQIFRLFGYAGTGKTTLARHIIDRLKVQPVLFGAFTGKAAYVLRSKGCDNAQTLHSMIYLPKEKVRARLNELTEQLKNESDEDKRTVLRRAIQIEERKLESPDWILRDPDQCDLSKAELLVIDEVSMVNSAMAADLLSFAVKTLVLGDPAQLPPVDGGGYFIDAQPDHLLTEIHRSALDSPVTRIATTVRTTPVGDRLYGVDDADGDNGRCDRLTLADLLDFDQVLVGRNASRWQMIHILRTFQGLTGAVPAPHDRIMILANSSEANVFNGQQFTVTACIPHRKRDDQVSLEVTDDEGRHRRLTAWTAGFSDFDGERQAKRDGRGTVVAATFAQAITTHKAQGSQWNKVLVVDEASVFNAGRYREKVRDVGTTEAARLGYEAGRQWLYTAVTRAAERIVIVPRINGLLA
jgi:exodeoxyribonuclease-5